MQNLISKTPITVEDLYQIIGLKEAKNFQLQKQVESLFVQIEEMAGVISELRKEKDGKLE